MHVTPLNYEFRTKIRRFKYETGNSQLWPSQPVHDEVAPKCCLKWIANESDFCPFLRRRRILEK